MLTPEVEFIDERDAVPRPPVKKLIWNGTEFVPLNLYRMSSPVGVVAYMVKRNLRAVRTVCSRVLLGAYPCWLYLDGRKGLYVLHIEMGAK